MTDQSLLVLSQCSNYWGGANPRFLNTQTVARHTSPPERCNLNFRSALWKRGCKARLGLYFTWKNSTAAGTEFVLYKCKRCGLQVLFQSKSGELNRIWSFAGSKSINKPKEFELEYRTASINSDLKWVTKMWFNACTAKLRYPARPVFPTFSQIPLKNRSLRTICHQYACVHFACETRPWKRTRLEIVNATHGRQQGVVENHC